MNMHDDFPPAAAPAKSASKVSYKKMAETSAVPIWDATCLAFWAVWKRPFQSIIFSFGLLGAIGAVGPFVSGTVGFEAAPNAPVNEQVANWAGRSVLRPVVGGVTLAVAESDQRRQNQYVNFRNGGTLTPSQVSALQATQVSYRRSIPVVRRSR